MIPKEMKYNLHYGEVRGDVVPPPYGTNTSKALLQLANVTLGPDATHSTEIHKKLIRIKAPNSVNASKRKHKNQTNHNDKQRRALIAYSTVYHK